MRSPATCTAHYGPVPEAFDPKERRFEAMPSCYSITGDTISSGLLL